MYCSYFNMVIYNDNIYEYIETENTQEKVKEYENYNDNL